LTGAIGSARELVRIEPADGTPDGLTVDAEGHLWIALWNGACIRRYAPSGAFDSELSLPVSQVTSCAFGGQDLGDLFATSASIRLSPEDRERQPLAGGVFVTRPGVMGIAGRRCRRPAL
jgi:sugar lactone lactonase YvrE